MTLTRIPSALFVTGTDTNVGKTHVTCLIARQLISRGLSVAAYKPVCSGAVDTAADNHGVVSGGPPRWDDIDRLKAAIGGQWPDEVICPQRFLAAVAPPVAAKLEGKSVDFELAINGAFAFKRAGLLLIEGAGGWLSPLTDTKTVADLAVALKVPVLIVARAGLGTINHTLLTVEAVRSRGLTVAGVVLNQPVPANDDLSVQTNADEIEARSGVTVFGMVDHGNQNDLCRAGRSVTIQWQQLVSGQIK